MRPVWLLPAPLLAACGLASVATGGLVVPDDASATANDGSTVHEGSTAPGDDAGPCDPSACSGLRCESGACAYFGDCKDLRDNGPKDATSGTYTFERGSAGTFTAYCEMALAGGGWTLVGQSGAGVTARFGWNAATGSVATENAQYSLDAVGHGLTMTEALLATGSRTAIRTAYVAQLPAGFPAGYANKAAPAQLTTVQNPDCSPGISPSMISNIGHTALTGQFFFRDNTGTFGTGLLPGGWFLYYLDDCDRAGKMSSMPGLLFVR